MKSASKKLIMGLVSRHLAMAVKDHTDSQIRLEVAKEGHRIWDKYNPEDGVGFASTNPYNIHNANEQHIKTKEALRIAQEAYDFALNVFLDEG
jgi:hypothetical protein